MNGSERFAVAHRNYLTFTLDLIALGPQLKSLGGGKEAILDHGGAEYRLRITANGRLILTK